MWRSRIPSVPNCIVAPGDSAKTNGRLCGGAIPFGGGVPLYKGKTRVGGLGVSGDTACADHEIAKRVRHLAQLDPEKGPAADDIAYSSADGASPFTHPLCANTWRNGQKLGESWPRAAIDHDGSARLDIGADPAGPQAAHEARLFWFFFGVTGVVFVVVLAALALAIVTSRKRRDESAHERQARDRRAERFVSIGIVATVVILFVLLISSVRTGRLLASLQSTPRFRFR